jgi:hypothetical protein
MFQGCVVTVAIFGQDSECGDGQALAEAEDWWLRRGSDAPSALESRKIRKGSTTADWTIENEARHGRGVAGYCYETFQTNKVTEERWNDGCGNRKLS